MSKETERAWAAGFLDGEGGVYCQLQGRTTPCIDLRVTQKTPDLLLRFAAAVGGGRIKYIKNRDAFDIRIHGLSNVNNVLTKLWPFLGSAKREQSIKAIEVFIQAPRGYFTFRSSHDISF